MKYTYTSQLLKDMGVRPPKKSTSQPQRKGRPPKPVGTPIANPISKPITTSISRPTAKPPTRPVISSGSGGKLANPATLHKTIAREITRPTQSKSADRDKGKAPESVAVTKQPKIPEKKLSALPKTVEKNQVEQPKTTEKKHVEQLKTVEKKTTEQTIAIEKKQVEQPKATEKPKLDKPTQPTKKPEPLPSTSTLTKKTASKTATSTKKTAPKLATSTKKVEPRPSTSTTKKELSLTEKILGKRQAEKLVTSSSTESKPEATSDSDIEEITPEEAKSNIEKQYSSKSTEKRKPRQPNTVKEEPKKLTRRHSNRVDDDEPVKRSTRSQDVEENQPEKRSTRSSDVKENEPVKRVTRGRDVKENVPEKRSTRSHDTKEDEPVQRSTRSRDVKKAEPVTRSTRSTNTKDTEPVTKSTRSKDTKENQPVTRSTRNKEAQPEKRSTRNRDTKESQPAKKSTRSKETTEEEPEKKRGGRKRSIDKGNSEKPAKSRRTHKALPILSDAYKLKVVIKGHTESNIPARMEDEFEDSKDLWCCAFEPSSDIAAICGSYTVLFLDTDQGRYMKKYTHPEIKEIFYCMAWSTLDENECRVLAVAGRLGSIKLLNPLQNECYRYLFGHRKAVLALAFSKVHPSWLFSASADHTVRLWDIGSPTSETDDSMCLASFVLPSGVGAPCALAVSYDMSTLVVGCNSGDMVKFDIPKEDLKEFKNRADEYREQMDVDGSEGVKAGPITTFDEAYVYPHGDEWHEGYIDDLCILGQDGNKKSTMNKKIVSRGADDMEILIWDPVKSKKTDASIDKALEWPDSAECTGLKFKVVESDDQKVLIAGDYEGQIRIYNVGDGKKSKTLKDNSLEQFPATRILSHKMSEELIRDVCCSNDTRTIVAVDNNNTVFIWTASSMD